MFKLDSALAVKQFPSVVSPSGSTTLMWKACTVLYLLIVSTFLIDYLLVISARQCEKYNQIPDILCLHAKAGKEQFCLLVQHSIYFSFLNHLSNVSQWAKPDFVLKGEHALESDELSGTHRGCPLLLQEASALLIIQSLYGGPSLGALQYTEIHRSCSTWTLNEVWRLHWWQSFSSAFLSNFTLGAVISMFLRLGEQFDCLYTVFLELNHEYKRAMVMVDCAYCHG